MKLFTLLLLALLAVLMPFDRGVAQITEPARVSPYSAAGSIFPGGNNNGRLNSLISDPIGITVGDFVTVIVNLSTSATLSKQLNTAKAASVADTITSLVTPTNSNLANAWSANQSFKGGGSQADTEGLTTTLQARIVEVLPNDTFRIEAHRQMQIGKEKSTMVITGLVRKQDLASDNSISSTQVAELEIKQDGAGDLSRSERKGWLTTFYEVINPF